MLGSLYPGMALGFEPSEELLSTGEEASKTPEGDAWGPRRPVLPFAEVGKLHQEGACIVDFRCAEPPQGKGPDDVPEDGAATEIEESNELALELELVRHRGREEVVSVLAEVADASDETAGGRRAGEHV
jgi:hypothetical protein